MSEEHGVSGLSTTATETNRNGSENKTTADIVDCEGYESEKFLLRSLWMYGGYPILVLGTVGHLLSVLLLLTQKAIRAMSLCVFLVTMSVAGLMSLYVGLLPTIVRHHSCDYTVLMDMTSEFGCRLHVAAIYFSFQLYSWMEACIAVERVSAVMWPHHYKTRFSQRNNFIALSVIVIVLLAINYVPFRSFGYLHGFSCDVVDKDLFRSWRYAHCIICIALPVVVMLTSNGLTLFVMCHSNLRNNASVQKAKPITIMMILLNGVFIVTTVPIMVGDWEGLDNSAFFTVEVIWCVCRLLMYLGSSLTFCVYLMVATRFRKALVEFATTGKSQLERALSALSGGAFKPSTRSDRRGNGYHGNSSTDGTSDGAL